MSDLPSSPEGESRSLYEENQPRFRQEATAHAQQFYVDSDNRLTPASPAVVTSEQYAELQQVVKREEDAARLELLELDSFLHNQTQVRVSTKSKFYTQNMPERYVLQYQYIFNVPLQTR